MNKDDILKNNIKKYLNTKKYLVPSSGHSRGGTMWAHLWLPLHLEFLEVLWRHCSNSQGRGGVPLKVSQMCFCLFCFSQKYFINKNWKRCWQSGFNDIYLNWFSLSLLVFIGIMLSYPI